MTSTPPPAGSRPPLDYRQAGVDYDLIDPLKVAAQRAAAATAGNLAAHGFSEVAASRGESAYVVDVGPFYLASIVECLGSKALVADEMQRLTGRSYYDGIAQDTIAMAVNDLITVGATPLLVQAYWGAGGSDWFGDANRAAALVAGWKRACDRCGVAWGGGETPALAGIVAEGRIDLAAACTGLVNPKSRLSLGEALAPGDAIVLLESSGIHANGVSLARKLVERLPQGYLTPLPGSCPRLWRGPAGADPPVPAGHRSTAPQPDLPPLLRQHHRPWLAQAAAPSARPALPHPRRCRRSRRCSASSSGTPVSTIARPTAPSTWAPASRFSSTPPRPSARVAIAAGQGSAPGMRAMSRPVRRKC